VLGFYTFKDVVIEDLLDRSGQIIEPPEEYRGQSAIQLDLLYTFPLCRRHRVATALIEHAKTKLLQENQKSLLLVEFEDQDRFGNTAEQYEKFFGKFGFKTIQSCKKKHELRKSTVNHVRMVYSAQK
jgi:GNAT superfamily N-acetyltransferase